MIRRLVPSDCGMSDTLVWLAEKSGKYTTKSGYALAKINTTEKQEVFNWRKCVWNVNCSPKIKNFLWKLANNAMAVGESLLKRGIMVDGKCKRCGEIETTTHVMFLCPYAQKVWEKIPALFVPRPSSVSSIEELLKACTKMINLPPVGVTTALYPWILWVLWTSRNQLVFEDKSFSETEVLGKAIKHAREWQDSTTKALPLSVSSKDCSGSVPQIQQPESAVRCFTDAAWNGASGAGGMGWFCPDTAGSTILQGSASCPFVASAIVAEALALKAAIKAAISHNIKDLICFSDSKGLINLITGNTSVIALQGILHDISVLSSSLSSISFKFIPRHCNTIADRLAKEALFLFQIPLLEV